jgi:hypothetical protein
MNIYEGVVGAKEINTILSPEKTHYDKIYLRTYEPDFVRL